MKSRYYAKFGGKDGGKDGGKNRQNPNCYDNRCILLGVKDGGKDGGKDVFLLIRIGIRRPWIVLFAAVDDDRSHLISEVSERMCVFRRDVKV